MSYKYTQFSSLPTDDGSACWLVMVPLKQSRWKNAGHRCPAILAVICDGGGEKEKRPTNRCQCDQPKRLFFFFQRGWAFIMTCLTAKQKKKDEERSKKTKETSVSLGAHQPTAVCFSLSQFVFGIVGPRVFGGFELLLTNRGIIKLPTGSTRDCHVQSFNRTAFRHPTLADPLSAHLQVHVS